MPAETNGFVLCILKPRFFSFFDYRFWAVFRAVEGHLANRQSADGRELLLHALQIQPSVNLSAGALKNKRGSGL
jgi:hypothetical protein